MAKSPFSNKSNDFINIALGIIIFFLIQVLFLALSSPESGFMARAEYATTPFTAWWNLGKASPNFLKPATHIIDTMTGTNETILNVTGNITNG